MQVPLQATLGAFGINIDTELILLLFINFFVASVGAFLLLFSARFAQQEEVVDIRVCYCCH